MTSIFTYFALVAMFWPSPLALHDWFGRGQMMTDAEIEPVVATLRGDPHDMEGRLILMGHYSMRRETIHLLRQHVIWLVERHPHFPFACDMSTHFVDSPTDLANVNRQWRKHLARWPEDPAILTGAACFMIFESPSDAKRLAETAARIAPWDPEPLVLLADLYASQGSREAHSKAAHTFEQAAALSTGERQVQIRIRGVRAAVNAHDWTTLRAIAKALLSQAPDSSDAIHWGRIAQGHVDFSENRIESACENLLASVDGVRSVLLESYGPDVSLAARLLDAGKRKVVLDYLNECRHLWKCNQRKVDEWTEAVLEGESPSWNVFDP